MMLQVLYTLPVGIMLWRNGGATGTAGVAFGPTLVVIAGQLAGSLAWIALSAEDAPDFLATAPVTRGEIERGKLAAIALPVAAIMTPPLVALAFASPWGAFCALGCGIGASLSAALLMLWRQAPARRGLVLRRHSQSKLVALVEHWLSHAVGGRDRRRRVRQRGVHRSDRAGRPDALADPTSRAAASFTVRGSAER